MVTITKLTLCNFQIVNKKDRLMLSIINLFDKTREPANARHKKRAVLVTEERQVHHKLILQEMWKIK